MFVELEDQKIEKCPKCGSEVVKIHPKKDKPYFVNRTLQSWIRTTDVHKCKTWEVVISKHWKNRVTGATASIYGACPYTSDEDKLNWIITSRGFSLRNNLTNTIGTGRKPYNTIKEAIEARDKLNNL